MSRVEIKVYKTDLTGDTTFEIEEEDNFYGKDVQPLLEKAFARARTMLQAIEGGQDAKVGP